MNADTGDPDVQDPEATKEDTRKFICTITLLVALDQEIEDIEADLDPIEGTILVTRAALSAVNQDISRETVQKWDPLVEIVAQDLPLTEEEIAQETDQETDTEEKRESKITLATQEAEKEITEREDLPADLLATPSDEDDFQWINRDFQSSFMLFLLYSKTIITLSLFLD